MQTHWRLALMFDAQQGDLAALEEGLKRAGDAIRAAAHAHGVRIGVADRHPDLGGDAAYADGSVLKVDGAVELSIANGSVDEIPALCTALRPIIAGLTNMASLHVMTGPMFPMVPVRVGGIFLSLSFRRDPGITSKQFRDWWYNRHSRIAIPVLGDGLLAYDQVHVEQPPSQAAAAGFGVAHVEYDAYDNLTWADRNAYLHSISNPEDMAVVYADEVGKIDSVGKRYAMMKDIG
jgi:hypothetical protein